MADWDPSKITELSAGSFSFLNPPPPLTVINEVVLLGDIAGAENERPIDRALVSETDELGGTLSHPFGGQTVSNEEKHHEADQKYAHSASKKRGEEVLLFGRSVLPCGQNMADNRADYRKNNDHAHGENSS